MTAPLLPLALRAVAGFKPGRRVALAASPEPLRRELLAELEAARPDLTWQAEVGFAATAFVLVVAGDGGLPPLPDGHTLVVLCPVLSHSAVRRLQEAPYRQRVAPVLLHSPEAVLELRVEGLLVHALQDGLSALDLQTRLDTPLLAPSTLGPLPPLATDPASR